MRPTATLLLIGLCLSPLAHAAEHAPGPQDPAARIAAQRQAMQALAFLDGQWRGSFTMRTPDGAERKLVHTERVGTLLDGSVRLIEGTSYGEDGKAQFNALGVVSFDPDTRRYTMHSHAQGREIETQLTVRADGFSWETPMGPGASLRYTATVSGGHWHETGERVVAGKPAGKVMELDLQRIGDSDWPAAGAVGPR